MIMNEKYLKRLRLIGDVVSQELSRGFCEKNTKILHREIIALPNVHVLQRKRLPKSWGIYFVLDQSDNVVYIGKATGSGFYGRWCNHQKLKFLDQENSKIAYLELSNISAGNDLLNVEQSLIWILNPELNNVRGSYPQSFAEVFWDCQEDISLEHIKKFLGHHII
jgi:hypothetical protein